MVDSGRLAVAPEVVFQEVDGELILLDMRDARYYGLDAVGLRCWQLLARHGDVDRVVVSMLEEFEVDEATVRSDVRDLARRLLERRLLVDTAQPAPEPLTERNAD